MSVIKKVKSGIIFVLIATIFIFSVPLGETAQASSNNIEEKSAEILNSITEEEFNIAIDTLEQGITVENGEYVFDSNAVENTSLTEEQIDNLDSFVNNYLTQEEIKVLDNGISDSDISVENMKNERALPAILIAAASAAAIFAGAVIAAEIISDLYRLSAISFCRSWKKYSAIKQACKDLGYL